MALASKAKGHKPLAKSKSSRTKSRSAATTSRSGKSTAGKRSAAKKPAGKSSNKSGNKKSLRTLAKETVKATVKPKAKTAAAKPAATKPKPLDNKWLKAILGSLNEMKAEDTVTIDLSDKSSIGEIMVVTTGRSNVHLQAIADRVVKDLKASGMTGIAVEGQRQGDWVVIDTGSVLVHIFRPEVRAFYSIEKMWGA